MTVTTGGGGAICEGCLPQPASNEPIVNTAVRHTQSVLMKRRNSKPKRRTAGFPACGFGRFFSSPYVFSVVGTSRCDVRAACSGAIPLNASVDRIFVPPATTRAGTAQRAIPTIALHTDSGRQFDASQKH